MLKYIKILIKIVFSAAFFIILFSFVKTGELRKVFAHVDLGFLLVSALVTVAMVVSSCGKWKVILDLKQERTRLSFLELLRVYLIGYFFSNILPSTVGGDLVRAYYVGKKIDNQPFSAAAVFLERFSGIVVLFVLVIVTPLCKVELYKNPYVYLPACSGALLLLLLAWLSWFPQALSLPDRIVFTAFHFAHIIARKTGLTVLGRCVAYAEKFYKKLRSKLLLFRDELTYTFTALRHNKVFFIKITLLTLLYYLLTWVNVYTSYLAFGVTVDFWYICAIVPAIMLVAHMPVTLLGNLGYYESVFVFYFLLAGVGTAESLAMGLLLRVKLLAAGLIGFGIYLAYRDKKKLDIQEILENKKVP